MELPEYNELIDHYGPTHCTSCGREFEYDAAKALDLPYPSFTCSDMCSNRWAHTRPNTIVIFDVDGNTIPGEDW
jgi:hypothetical protein